MEMPVHSSTCDQRLESAFRQALALPGNFYVRSAQFNEMRQWDSIAHLQLVVAIEDAFGIRLDPSDVIDLKSYAEAVRIIKDHGAWSDD